MPAVALESLFIILKAYVILMMWQMVFWPITSRLFPSLPDKAWSIARIFGILATSLILWTASNLGIKANSDIGLTVVIMLFVLLVLSSTSGSVKKLFPKNVDLKIIVMAEYLFFACFFLISFVRGYLPHLDSLEKFMDYGFINTYLRSSTLPVTDMWQAGQAINYYSFGQYWASILIRSFVVDPSVGYNLVLGFIAGTVASLTMVLVTVLSESKKKATILGGLLAAVLMVFGGNGHTFWYFLSNLSMDGYWYADATRFIHNTIHEFPSYSLIVSDLHGHLLDLPVVLLYLLVIGIVTARRSLVDTISMGVLMGIMMMTNTWDVLIYGLLTVIYYTYLLFRKKILFKEAVGQSLIVATSMISVMCLWWIKFVPISNGIGMVGTRSPLWQIGVLWMLTGLICLVAFVLRKHINSGLVGVLAVLIVILILIPEFIYFKDIYPDHPRANTMFKLTYQAFVLSIVVFGVISTIIFNYLENNIKKLALVVVVLGIFCAKISFSTLAYPSFYGNFKIYYGLNGERWLEKESYVKYKMLEYLKESDDRVSTMIEAVGDSYTYKNVLSSYTGIPTIQGWRVHEWLWRGGYGPVAIREAEVRNIYEGESLDETRQILTTYKTKWIIVGPDEDEMYLINHPKILALGKKIDFDGGYYIVLVGSF